MTGSGGPWSAEHPGSHSPKSSNDEILFHNNNTAQKDGISKPVPTPQLPHPVILPQASSGCLPDSVPRLNSSMSCDELLSMLNSVTNPGVVSCGHCGGGGRSAQNNTSKDANKDNATDGSPVSRPSKRSIKDISSDGTDGAPMPSVPPSLRRNHSNNAIAALEPIPKQHQQQQQQQAFKCATPTPPVPMPQAPTSIGGQIEPLSTGPPSAPGPVDLVSLGPEDRDSIPHLVAPQQTEKLAASPFSTAALLQSSEKRASASLPSQQMAPQVYHTHHHHHPAPAPVVQHHQQQQQQHHYGGVSPPMMTAPIPHAHHHQLQQQQQQQQYPSAILPRQQRLGLTSSYPPPRQLTNGMPPLQMRHNSSPPYGNMMGMSPPPPPPGWQNGATMHMPAPLPTHHRMNMAPPVLAQPHHMPTKASKQMAMMGPPPRRGALSLNGVGSGMLPMHPHPPQYMSRAISAPTQRLPSMQMSMQPGAAPAAANAPSSQKMLSTTNAAIPVPSSLPPVMVKTPPAAAAAEGPTAGVGEAAKNIEDDKRDTSLKHDKVSLPPMPSAQLLADLPSLSPRALLSPAGGLSDSSTLSCLAATVPHRDMNTGNDPFHDINHIHLSPEEFDAVLAAFDTPGLEDAQT